MKAIKSKKPAREETDRRENRRCSLSWEYAQWMGDDNPQMARALKGPILNPGSPRAAFPPALLDIVKNVVLQDEHDIARLQTHYAMFRETIGPKWKMQSRRQQKSRRPRLTNAQKRQRRRQGFMWKVRGSTASVDSTCVK